MVSDVLSICPMDLGLSDANGVTMVEGENHGSGHTYYCPYHFGLS